MRRDQVEFKGGPPREARSAEEAALSVADDLAPLLESIGIRYRRADGGKKLTAPCPSPDHSDRSPSWFINNDPEDPEARFGTHACSSCSYRGGPVHLAFSAEGGTGDWGAAARLLRTLFEGAGGDVDVLLDRSLGRFRTSRRRISFDLDALGCVPIEGTTGERYARDRGLTPFLISVFGIRWAPRGVRVPRPGDDPLDFSRRVVLPVYRGGEVVTFAARAVSAAAKPKYLYPPSPRSALLWGMDYWNPAGLDVGLVEGILDGIAAHKVLQIPVYAALGARLRPEQAALLRTARSVTVIRDPNRAGKMLAEDAAKLINSVPDVSVIGKLPSGRDAGDTLRPKGDPARLDPDVLRRAYDQRRDAREREIATLVEYRRHVDRRRRCAAS
jgi:hypothetical protein